MRRTNVADLQATLGGMPIRSVLLELRQFAPVNYRTGQHGEPHWAGVLLGGDGAVPVRDLGTVAASAPNVATSLADPLSTAGRAASAALYQQLIAPFAVELTDVERLYIAPDGLLNLVSFGLLQDPAGAALMNRMDVRLLQSGRDLLRQPEAKPAKGLVATGGIDFDGALAPAAAPKPTITSSSFDTTALVPVSAGPSSDPGQLAGLERLRSATAANLRSGFGALAYSGEEVAAVAEQYRRARRDEPVSVIPGDRGPQPTKPWLLALRPPRVLHLATHGFYWPDKIAADRPMLLAGIALAGANQTLHHGGQDGILFALEAQDLNLEGSELVVLSACDTAQGRYDYGDGVAGLVRALRTAGARNVLVALRPVGDQSAAEFMQRFYHHWLTQTGPSDPAAALHAAQREYLGQPDRASNDQAWAAFILVEG